MFPYASHGIHGYSLEYCAPLLARAGSLANKYGHRLTTHPGQYTQLGSLRPEVVKAAVRELAYHCEMLDRMGVGIDGVMIVHVNLIVFANTKYANINPAGRWNVWR
jgi:UV DNA damage endonuclease